MITNRVNFVASNIEPSPIVADYWIDTSEDEHGRIIKTRINNEWVNIMGSSVGSTDDYNELSNKPKINGFVLNGEMNSEELGLLKSEKGKGLSEENFTTEMMLNVSEIPSMRSDIDELLSKNIRLSLSASPNLFFEGDTTKITIRATLSGGKGKIVIKKGNNILATSEDNASSVSANDTVSSSTSYAAEAVSRDKVLTASSSVTSVYPIYVGAGKTYTSVIKDENKLGLKRNPQGTYTINVKETGDKVFIIVPNGMSINKVTMSEFEFFFMPYANHTINGVNYKVYESENAMLAGEIILKVY